MDFRQSVNNKYVIGSLALFILFMGVVAYSYRSASSALGAVASNGGFPGIYNATTTDLALRDGYGSALAVDSGGRVILSPSSTGVGVSWDAVDGDILPDTNNAYDIGSGALSFKDFYTSGTLMVGNGTAANPSIAFGSDTNTGFYRYGGDIVGLTVGGTARMLIGSTGISASHNIVGTTNNTYNLGGYGNAFANIYSSSTSYLTEVKASGNVTSTGIIYTGQMSFAEDAGFPTWADMSVTNAKSVGTQMSYTAKIDGNNFMKLYSVSDGAGGIASSTMMLYPTRLTIGARNAASYIYVGTADGCGAWVFSASNTSPTLTPTSTDFCAATAPTF